MRHLCPGAFFYCQEFFFGGRPLNQPEGGEKGGDLSDLWLDGQGYVISTAK